MSAEYAEFLRSKSRPSFGLGPVNAPVASQLYDWQQAITRWAVRKGRAAIFADCGLGKTFMQCAWAHALDVRTLFLAPLCVAEQTVQEAAALGMSLHYALDGPSARGQFVITNYERLNKFDPDDFDAVVLDESSILKSFDGKTRTTLIEMFHRTTYRLCCTATPSPNDISELANHAEFLGLMTRAEFLATWFVHDDAGWRMKGHAVTPFYRWMASWAVALRKPSDIGFADDRFTLPPLRFHEHVTESAGGGDALFPELGLKGLTGRLRARKGSVEDRVAVAAELASHGGQWMLWCGLNPESEALAAMIPGAVEVTGSDDYGEKVSAVQAFVRGEARVLISKIRILGYGLNLQNCSQMAFVGIGDSFEQYYQAVRRCWRYGQVRPVDAHIIVSDSERAIVANVQRKESAHGEFSTQLIHHMSTFEKEQLWTSETISGGGMSVTKSESPTTAGLTRQSAMRSAELVTQSLQT